MTTNPMTRLQYDNPVTPEAITAALSRCRNRNEQPVAVVVRPDAEIVAIEVDGVTVTVSEKPRPERHWWVVCDE